MPAPVCADCFKGTLRGDVLPTGREEDKLYGLPTYVALPPSHAGTSSTSQKRPVGIIVVFADGFGWRLRNTRVLADIYAQRTECTVLVPDFMGGESVGRSVYIHKQMRFGWPGWLAG
jgi:hypothetical protein